MSYNIENIILFLKNSSLSKNEYEIIANICTDKIETLENYKISFKVNLEMEEYKKSIDEDHKLYDFIHNVTNIKAYYNDENDLQNPCPSIEYVIELTSNNKTFVFFNEVVYDNLNKTIKYLTTIGIEGLIKKSKVEETEEVQENTAQEDQEKEHEKEETEEDQEKEDQGEHEDYQEEDQEEDEEVENKLEFIFGNDNTVKQFLTHLEWELELENDMTNFLNYIFKAFESDEEIKW